MAKEIISLSPSFSTTLDALGYTDNLIGVTKHDAILDKNGKLIESVGGWLTPDLDRIDELEPDVVLTTDQLQRNICSELRERGHEVFHKEPETINETKQTIRELGERIDEEDKTEKLLKQMNRRFQDVYNYVTGQQSTPVVYCEEWANPPMAGGNWVPEVVINAGGQYPFCDPAERSREVSKDEVVEAGPELIVIHHCGTGNESAPETVNNRWNMDVNSIVLDDSLMNQPSPNLVFAVERLAEELHDYNPPKQEWPT